MAQQHYYCWCGAHTDDFDVMRAHIMHSGGRTKGHYFIGDKERISDYLARKELAPGASTFPIYRRSEKKYPKKRLHKAAGSPTVVAKPPQPKTKMARILGYELPFSSNDEINAAAERVVKSMVDLSQLNVNAGTPTDLRVEEHKLEDGRVVAITLSLIESTFQEVISE